MRAILIDVPARTISDELALAEVLSDTRRISPTDFSASHGASIGRDGAYGGNHFDDPHVFVMSALTKMRTTASDTNIIYWPRPDGVIANCKRDRAISSFYKKIARPLMVIHHEGGPEIKSVIAAIDTDPADQVALRLSCEVLWFSERMAAALQLPLDLVGTWRLLEEGLLRSARVNERKEVVDRLVESARQKSLRDLERFIAKHTNSESYRKIIHRKGETTHQLSVLTRKQRDSILVIGSRGRVGLAGLFLGNRAEKVIEYAECPVVVVKPELAHVEVADGWAA